MYQANFLPVPFKLGLYPIVDSVEWVDRLLHLGVKTLQLRIKNKRFDELSTDIASAIYKSQNYNARLFINDHWQLAIKHKAYGVHLGQNDLKKSDLRAIYNSGLRLGISVYNDDEVHMALKIRPSYVAIGHIFPTKTKKISFPPKGIKELRKYIIKFKNYPTVAIGGINLKNIASVLSTKVGGVAVIGAIVYAKNWELVTKKFLKLVGTGHK